VCWPVSLGLMAALLLEPIPLATVTVFGFTVVAEFALGSSGETDVAPDWIRAVPCSGVAAGVAGPVDVPESDTGSVGLPWSVFSGIDAAGSPFAEAFLAECKA